MTDHSPYAAQSPITDPGEMADWLSGLPADFSALRALARPLVAHYRADDLAAFGIPHQSARRPIALWAVAAISRCST
jgi:hypothetical protein